MITKNLLKDYVYPVATISGSIIGVGFFALPFIASKVGIWLMLIYFVVLTALVLSIHLIFGEISINTPDYKRFPGFVGFYLGKKPQIFSFFSVILGYFGVLLVYLIVGGQFLSSLLVPFFGQSTVFYTFLYFVLAGIIIYFGISAVSKFELGALLFLLFSFILVFIKSMPQFNFSNINAFGSFDIKNLFLPYGAIIFSLWGVGLIPEAEEMVVNSKNVLKKIIIISTLIPAVFYVLFILLILGITGSSTTESALTGLGSFLGNGVVLISLLVGVIITFSAFITHGLNLKKIFVYDLGVKEKQAFIFTCFTPMILFLLGLNSFVGLISFVGGVLLGIDGIMILLMYRKIHTGQLSGLSKNIIICFLGAVFILGIIYNIIFFIK